MTPVSSWRRAARKRSPCDDPATRRNTSGDNAGDAVRQAVKRKELQPIGEDQSDGWRGNRCQGAETAPGREEGKDRPDRNSFQSPGDASSLQSAFRCDQHLGYDTKIW